MADFTTIAGGSTSVASGSTSTGDGASSTRGMTSLSTSSLSTSTSMSVSTTSTTSTTSAPDTTSSTTSDDVGSDSDSSDTKPLGCQGKIDFLFVIEATSVMQSSQAKLIDAFPKFIETIEAKFDDFDYHIMVVGAEDTWGLDYCTSDCPALQCKQGDPCCPINVNVMEGEPCCALDYPCEEHQNLTTCDWTIGAGMVTPAGFNASNQRCNIANGRRYMTKGQPNLAGTFACVAQVGTSGNDRIGDALVEAVGYKINKDGGCNAGFLRDDALLMVTVISSASDDSQTYIYPWEWYDKVLVAKNDDPSSIIALFIGGGAPDCVLHNYPCKFVEMFTHHQVESLDAPDYGPAFEQATDLVATACEDFIPQ